MSYFDSIQAGSGYNDGYIICGLGIISLIISLINKNRILIVTGLLTLGLVALALIGFKSKISEASSAGSDVDISKLVQLQWGWAVLILGGVLLLVAGIMKKSVPAPPMSYGAPPPGYPPGPGQPPPPYNR